MVSVRPVHVRHFAVQAVHSRTPKLPYISRSNLVDMFNLVDIISLVDNGVCLLNRGLIVFDTSWSFMRGFFFLQVLYWIL